MWNGTEGMNTQELLKFIKKSTSPYHTVMAVEKILKAAELEPVMVMPEDPLFLPDE